MPTLKALVKREKEISEEMEVSNIQMMKGMSANIITPLTRCKMDTQPAAGSLYVGRSVKALIFLNSGRCLAGVVAVSDMRCFLCDF